MERGFRDPPIFFGSQLLKPSWGETENHLEFRWKKYLTIFKKILQESNEEIYFKNFPVSSHLHDLCKHYRTWSFQYNRDNACRWNVFSSSVTKRKCHKSRLRTFKFKSVLNSVSTTCACNTNSGTSCSPSSYLSGGIEPHSLSSSDRNLASVSRHDSMVELYNYLNGQGYWVNDLNGWTQRAKNIVNQRANIATGEKILWMGSQTHQNLLSSSRVITKQFIVHDLDKYLDKQLTT